MHLDVLTVEQREILLKLNVFKKQFYLVGGTAIALQIGHRFSIDFDLFTPKSFNQSLILSKFAGQNIVYKILFKNAEGLHLLCNTVKITFFEFPFPVKHPLIVSNQLSMPSLIDLSAMKAYALGRRSKWKDYVDMYFIMKNYFSFHQISVQAERLFGENFFFFLFKAQLGYFDDIDYSETVEFLPGFEVTDEIIKEFLSNVSLDRF